MFLAFAYVFSVAPPTPKGQRGEHPDSTSTICCMRIGINWMAD